MNRIRFAAAGLFFLLESHAIADPRETLVTELDAPAAASTAVSYASKGVIDASSDKTTATLKLGRLRPVDGSATMLRSFGLVGKTPFDSENDDKKDVGTSSGLTTGSSLRLEYGLLKWPEFRARSVAMMDEVCTTYLGRALPGYYWSRKESEQTPQLNLARPALGKSCMELLTPEGLSAVVDKINADAKTIAETNKVPEPPKLIPVAGYEEILKEGAAAYYSANQGGFQTGWGLNFALTGNRQAFSYASETAPTIASEETKSGRGVSITYSMIRNSSVFGVGASYERTYKGGKELEICSPIGTTGSLKCMTGALTAPERESNRLIFAEYRTALKKLPSFAISPRIEYAHIGSAFSVSLPIYLSADKDRVLDGGLSVNWDEEDHLSISIFVGKSFAFFE
jgi:hypothetical protein